MRWIYWRGITLQEWCMRSKNKRRKRIRKRTRTTALEFVNHWDRMAVHAARASKPSIIDGVLTIIGRVKPIEPSKLWLIRVKVNFMHKTWFRDIYGHLNHLGFNPDHQFTKESRQNKPSEQLKIFPEKESQRKLHKKEIKSKKNDTDTKHPQIVTYRIPQK